MAIRNLLVAAAVGPLAVAFAAPAQAQVSGIATVNQMRAVVGTKAFGTAFTQINTTFKTQIDQVTARRKAQQQEIAPLLAQIDTNKDQQLSEQEINAAQAAKNPAVAKIVTAQQNAERDIGKLQEPVIRAQAYATESILEQYEGAQSRVVTARKVAVILTPEAFIYAPDSADITSAVVAELDKAIPTVPVTPPANWQPQQGTMAFLQRFFQLAAEQQQQRAAQAPPPAGTAPARPATQPATQPQSR